MSTPKSSTITGALATKTVNWTEVPDEELATNIDDMDSVGNAKAREKRRRLCAARDAEIWRAEEARQEAEWKHQAEEVERRRKEEEARHQREAEAEKKHEAKKRKQATAAEARKRQWVDSEAQASGSWANTSVSCAKAKERCEWLEIGLMASRAAMSPRGGECKKQAKKVANEDEDKDDEIIILSGWKTKWQGGGKTLEEITDRWWGKLIQAVSTCMDVANGHLEQIASTVQSNGCKVQQHHLLMEGLVGQQQVLLSKLVEMAGATGSGGAKGTTEGQEGLKELRGEGSGGQEETEGVPGGVLEGEPEDALGNEPEDGAGLEDGTETEGQQSKTKGKGKEKAL
ncbi:hypothetical protein ID866_11989 [Astraeus odoratus]|nr:hypothetical protein ID866_11989 [Astraeus odoratus]